MLDEACPAWTRAASWAPSRVAWRVLAGSIPALGALAGSIWKPWVLLARPGWLDLASIGSLWLPLEPLLARFGLDWLDLAALGALAGSIWLSWSLLGALVGSIWLPWAPLGVDFAAQGQCFH